MNIALFFLSYNWGTFQCPETKKKSFNICGSRKQLLPVTGTIPYIGICTIPKGWFIGAAEASSAIPSEEVRSRNSHIEFRLEIESGIYVHHAYRDCLIIGGVRGSENIRR